uniref:Gustatory receptor n=1 Tax=Panagrolaimus davidi TaxID=227884 RepID=A0A914QRC9_9BILA
MILTFYTVSKKTYNISKDLRIYFAFCLDPYGTLLIVFSIVTGVHCAMQIRYAFLFIVLSRIVATVFYKHYSKYSSGAGFLALSIFITYMASLANGYIEFIRVFVDLNQYFFAIYINLGQHAVTLIFCKILQEVNKQKYKSLAYQSSLSERHQIYKNVKILKSIWPIVFICSTVSPIGPILVVCYRNIFETAGPTSLFYLSYNIAFLLVICWRLTQQNENLDHINTIGKNIVQMDTKNSQRQMQLKIIPVESYFNNLEKQWK